MKTGRPPSADRRDPRGVRFSAAELATIRGRALTARMPVNAFIRRAALGRPLVSPVPELNRLAWGELSRLAANINQLSRLANSGKMPSAHTFNTILKELSSQLVEVRLSLVGDIADEDDVA